MRVVGAIPALPVRDVGRSVRFYRDTLGFTAEHEEAGFAIVRRDAVQIHLWGATDERWRTRSAGASPVVSGAESFIAGTASCRLTVDGIDALYRELEPRGVVHPRGALATKPWGTREFGVLDLDRNLITFVQPIPSRA